MCVSSMFLCILSIKNFVILKAYSTFEPKINFNSNYCLFKKLWIGLRP